MEGRGTGRITIGKVDYQARSIMYLPGLCKVATLEQIKSQGWSLNTGRYVGVAMRGAGYFNFMERLVD